MYKYNLSVGDADMLLLKAITNQIQIICKVGKHIIVCYERITVDVVKDEEKYDINL